MAKARVPRYMRPGKVRPHRITNFPRPVNAPKAVNFPRKFLKRPVETSPNTILAESGYQLVAENGDRIRTET